MIGENDLRVYLDKFDKKYWATYKVLDILQKVFYRSAQDLVDCCCCAMLPSLSTPSQSDVVCHEPLSGCVLLHAATFVYSV